MNTINLSQPQIELLNRIQSVLPDDLPAYLVGGAVRDAMLSRPIHDLDFVLPHHAMEIGRRVADILGAAFYPLDSQRYTARVIFIQPDGKRLLLDFATYQGNDLESDLRNRDLTINAMAIPMRPPRRLIDPLEGANDLRKGLLRSCSPTSFLDDPVRILRCVRQAVSLGSHILPETMEDLRKAIPALDKVSPERVRDEIFRILDGPKPDVSLQTLERLGVLVNILPELSALKGVKQTSPHIDDVWTHTLGVVGRLSYILNILSPQPDPNYAANWAAGFISLRLGRYRQQLYEHLANPLNPDRKHHALLMLAGLYHDVAKPLTQKIVSHGRIRFIEHERLGAKIIHQRAAQLHLSNPEAERLATIVHNHMRPILLAQLDEPPTRRAIYRFFRDCGPAGIDVGLLSLADTLSTYGHTLPQDIWTRQVDTIRTLWGAWWEQREESVAPPALTSGHDLIEAFKLKPGPLIGELLETIREAQAIGELHTRQEALTFAQTWLDKNPQ